MNKKIVILIIFILILIAGGVFWWWEYYETPPEKWDTAEYSKPEDYIIKDTPEGKIIENKKAGISFKVPEGWRAEGAKEGRNYISLFSPDGEEEKTVLMKRGCRIMPEVVYIKTDIRKIKEKFKKDHETFSWLLFDKYEIFKINHYKALRNILEDQTKFNLYHIGVYIPTKNILTSNKLYLFELTASLKDKERCSKEFDKFLETVKID